MFVVVQFCPWDSLVFSSVLMFGNVKQRVKPNHNMFIPYSSNILSREQVAKQRTCNQPQAEILS